MGSPGWVTRWGPERRTPELLSLCRGRQPSSLEPDPAGANLSLQSLELLRSRVVETPQWMT